jgi:hypothetical protein
MTVAGTPHFAQFRQGAKRLHLWPGRPKKWLLQEKKLLLQESGCGRRDDPVFVGLTGKLWSRYVLGWDLASSVS